MRLTVGQKLNKCSAFRRKSHHSIETLLAGFHDSPLSMSNFVLEVKNAVFFSSGGWGGGGRNWKRSREKP